MVERQYARGHSTRFEDTSVGFRLSSNAQSILSCLYASAENARSGGTLFLTLRPFSLLLLPFSSPRLLHLSQISLPVRRGTLSFAVCLSSHAVVGAAFFVGTVENEPNSETLRSQILVGSIVVEPAYVWASWPRRSCADTPHAVTGRVGGRMVHREPTKVVLI